MEEDADLYGNVNKVSRTDNFKYPSKSSIALNTQQEICPISIQNLVDHSSVRKVQVKYCACDFA